MPVTDVSQDKPKILAIYQPSTDSTASALTAGPAVDTEVPWFFREGVAPDGARARLEAARALVAAIGALTKVLSAAVEAGAATPAEAAQLALLAGWSRRLEVEASILERELRDLGPAAP